MHIDCIFIAYRCIFYAYILHIRYVEVYVMAYFLHIKCIFTAYLLHMLCIFLHIECIFWAYICIFWAYDLHICYVEVNVIAYFVHILVWNCISNAYSSSAGPRDGQVPGCSDFFRVPIPFRSYGSAKSCSCFHSYLQMIKKESSTNVPSFQSSRNIQDEGVQVAYCAYISWYICMYSVNYIAYTCVFGILICFWKCGRMAWSGKLEDDLRAGGEPESALLFAHHTHLGKAPLGPCWPSVGDKGTFPHSMRGESAEFPGASCDSEPDKGDGCRWWYVNSWAMIWSSRM